MASNLAEMSLVEVADGIRERKFTAVEVLDAVLVQVDKVDSSLNASIWIDREGAYAAASTADKALASRSGVGTLHGVPMAHKNMFAQAGMRCTFGSNIYGEYRPSFNATVIERLASAGAYCFAGLNMAEFAQGGTGHNAHFGDVRNAWDPRYVSGGSSSASGAAVAACMTFGSLGSDTGGSIRLPASANGVTGMKPTQTRVSRHGAMPLSFSMDNVGVLTRSAHDCARLLKVIAGHDDRDPSSAKVEVADYESALVGNVRGLRIGIPNNHFLDNVSHSVMKAYEAALAVLKERGAQLVYLDLPLMDAINAYATLIPRVESSQVHMDNMRAGAHRIAKHINARIYAGMAIPATYYVEAVSRRGSVLREFAKSVFGKVDLLVTPTIAIELPTRAATDIDQNDSDGVIAHAAALGDNTRPFNYLGLPCVSIPCGFDSHGLPVGLQLSGKPFDEAAILRVADAFQQDTHWHTMRPPVGRDIA